jgi:ribosomal protein L37AE/L43A
MISKTKTNSTDIMNSKLRSEQKSVPEDKQESYLCDYCAGSVTLRDDGWWSCSICDFEVESERLLNENN